MIIKNWILYSPDHRKILDIKIFLRSTMICLLLLAFVIFIFLILTNAVVFTSKLFEMLTR